MVQGTNEDVSFHIVNHQLETVDNFTYLGSTITGKAVSTMSKLSKRVLDNRLLTLNTKPQVKTRHVSSAPSSMEVNFGQHTCDKNVV